MTAAGSSAQDTLHQLYDAGSRMLGGGGADTEPAQQPADGSAPQANSSSVGGGADQEKPNNTSSQNQQQVDGESSQGSWLSSWLPGRWGAGPGNHPDDPNATINRPYYTDTVGRPSDDGEQQDGQKKTQDSSNKFSKEDKKRNKATNHQSQEKRKDGKHDALQRALSEMKGPMGYRDDEYTKEHRKVDPNSHTNNDKGRKKQNVAPKSYDTSSDESPESDDNEESKDSRHPSAYPTKPERSEHPANRGPMWASRPDDAQRAKIKEMKKKQAQQYRDERRKSKQPAQDRQDETSDDEEGADQSSSARPAPGRKSTTSSNQQGGSTGRSHSARLSAILGTSKDKSSTSDRPSSDEPKSEEQTQSTPLKGVFGAFQQDSSASYQAPKVERPKAQQQHSQQSGQTTDQETPRNDDGRPNPKQPDPNSNDPAEAKMAKISNMMLGKDDGAAKQANGDAAGSQDTGNEGETTGAAKWAMLKQRVQATGAVAKRRGDKRKEAARQRVLGGSDIVSELQSGILPVFMLKMALERDESGHRRVPVLLNHLRLNVTDSLNPLHNTSAVFRIELSYGDDMMKWVIHRTLGDLIALHTHYRAAALKSYFGRAVKDTGTADGEIGLPRFPKTSLPYFRQLQSQGKVKGDESRKMFARIQRDAVEEYILALIKRTLFRPEANRLCKFFELSVLGVSLASRGGFSGKQGYLRILSNSGRKTEHHSVLSPVRWVEANDPKWFIVRESYIAISPGPETLEVHDVFLIDGEFSVERPKRLYKQATHVMREVKGGGDDDGQQEKSQGDKIGHNDRNDNTALLTEGAFKKEQTEAAADENEKTMKKRAKDANTNVSSHTFYIHNAERKLKLSARSDRLLEQFVASLERVARQSPFAGSNRFASFAPIRLNVNAQWLVDGRDYFWEVSRALLLAKDRIMIHDWWLSPELYLRRPGEPKWRLDNILQKKAEEGVKIFVILYNEVSNNFTPTDSGYTKSRLSALHPNIYVQRSPSHFQTGTFYWAHHEKMCAIDETIAFMGGFDLCFGRYDTPAHVLVDDLDVDYQKGDHKDENLLGPANKDGKEAHIWPGQDYANERVAEWSDLTKPAEDLFDRTRFPRMPWHDTGLQLIGQPARDLCRHFTQRWNYLLRSKNHRRKFPFLLPAPDFTHKELEKYQLTGTCEVQICRSAGPWSLGTSKTVEHSIQNAYLKCIQMSDHFVYIENQFFVTSTQVEGTVIENNIGNALVSRIIRAHREGTPWRAIIVIPLIPGFPMPISEPDASSVRIICDCQFRSICRGEHSIFGKLRREGIDPDQYISFFSLRNWGKLKGGQLTTEQVYIHGKCAMIDDRIAIIGSANINERSQRGDRDSELACVIRDTDMIDSTMAGKPYKVGRFAHTLRIRLMREHLGIDVDELERTEANLDIQELQAKKQQERAKRGPGEEEENEHEKRFDPDDEQRRGAQEADDDNITRVANRGALTELNTHVTGTIGDMMRGATKQAGDFLSDPRDGMPGENPVQKAARVKMEHDSGSSASSLSSSDEERDDANDKQTREEAQQMEKAEQKKKRANLDGLLNSRRGGAESPPETAGEGVHDESTRDTSAAERAKENLSTTLEERRMVEIHVNPDEQKTANGDDHSEEAHSADEYDDASRRRRGKSEAPEGTKDRTSRMSRNPHRMDESASAPNFGSKEEARRKVTATMSPNPWTAPLAVPKIEHDCFADPLIKSFYSDRWLAVAVHNTQIYRKVFRCVPDDTVTNWGEYKAFMAWSDRLSKSGTFASKEGKDSRTEFPEGRGPGAHFNRRAAGGKAKDDKKLPADSEGTHPELQDEEATKEGAKDTKGHSAEGPTNQPRPGSKEGQDDSSKNHKNDNTDPSGSFSPRELSQMESLLEETVGNLVIFPTRFLETEDRGNNFLFPMDRVNPLTVYA